MRNKNSIIPIFLIGAMKSGTSTLYKHLSLHPEICCPTIKEPEYFSVNMGHPEYKIGDYFDLFKLTKSHNYILDASTGYAKFPMESGVPERIFSYGLLPKIIYIVRNPLDRIESHYNHMTKYADWNSSITSENLINTSRYYMQLQQYLHYFKKEDILVLNFDDLVNDYKTVLRKVYDFVEIKDEIFSEKSIQNNKTKPVNRKKIVLKSKLRNILKYIPIPVKTFARRIFDFFFVTKKSKLSKKQKNYVKSKIEEDIKCFGKEFSFDVEKWGF